MSNDATRANAPALPTTRRTLLATMAGTGAALSLPKLATAAEVAAIGGHDPVFAAIEEHRVAWVAFEIENAKGAHVVDVPNDVQTTIEAAMDVEREALSRLYATQPTTGAGLRALVEHFDQFHLTDGDALETVFAVIHETCRTLFPA